MKNVVVSVKSSLKSTGVLYTVCAYTDGMEVGVELGLSDFLAALVEETTNIPMILTKQGLLEKLTESSNAVLLAAKQSTRHL
jgi:hypothetical protein